MVDEKDPKKKKEVAEGLGGMGELGKKKPPEEKKPEVAKPAAKESEVESLKKELEAEKSKTKSLEKERSELEDKSKGLAEIIEKVSSKAEETKDSPATPPAEPVEPKLKDLEKKLTDQFQTQLKELKDSMVAIGTKIESAGKTEKPESGKVKKLVDKIQSETTSKISALEDTIKKLSDKLTAPEVPAGKGGEDVSKGLAALGGNVELQSNLEDVKRSFKELERTFTEMRDENESRFARIKEQMKRLEKLPSLEERVQALVEKLGPENIEKLKKLVFSTEELSNQVIPQEINKALSKEISPFTGDIKSLKDGAAKLNGRIKRVYNEMSYFKGELKTLYKFGDYIGGLQSEIDKTRVDIKEREGKLSEKIAGLEMKLKEKSEEISDKIKIFKKDYSEFIEELVNRLFRDMAETKLSEVKDKTSKELTSFKDEMDIIASRFYQFENTINPAIEMIKEQMGKFEKNLGRIKNFQEKLNLNVEKSIEKKFTDISRPALSEIEGKLSKTMEMVDEKIEGFGSELSQFADVVNPTMEMFKGDLESFNGRLDKLNEFQSNLSDKIKEIKLENKDLFKTLGSLERLEENIEILDGKTKEIDDLKDLLDKRISELDNKLKTLNERLSEQKRVLGRVDSIEKVLNDFSVEISKLSDGSAAIEKEIEDNRNLFEEGMEELRSEISQFENVVKPSLDLFKNNLGEFADSLQGLKEKEGKLKDDLKETKINEKEMSKRLSDLESYIENISQMQKGIEYLESSRKSFVDRFERTSERVKTLGERISSAKKSIEGFDEKWKELKTIGSFQEKMEKRISRLEKELVNTRAQFENVVEQSLMDRKKLEETSRKQKERINSLLAELRG
ncbi:MAG: hypothetical protein GTN76_04335 [Candidatus Aenigmarchaeota archaeon]|nr:hypothetical protein [Candidatus Aenigmarchaeota archaeon]